MATKRKAGNKRKAKPKLAATLLRLDAGIYPLAALRLAQKAFAHLAAIRIQRTGRHHLVRFGKVSGQSGETVADEFANYALGCLMVAP